MVNTNEISIRFSQFWAENYKKQLIHFEFRCLWHDSIYESQHFRLTFIFGVFGLFKWGMLRIHGYVDSGMQAAFFYFSSWEPEGVRATFLPNFPPNNPEKIILLFNFRTPCQVIFH